MWSRSISKYRYKPHKKNEIAVLVIGGVVNETNFTSCNDRLLNTLLCYLLSNLKHKDLWALPHQLIVNSVSISDYSILEKFNRTTSYISIWFVNHSRHHGFWPIPHRGVGRDWQFSGVLLHSALSRSDATLWKTESWIGKRSRVLETLTRTKNG